MSSTTYTLYVVPEIILHSWLSTLPNSLYAYAVLSCSSQPIQLSNASALFSSSGFLLYSLISGYLSPPCSGNLNELYAQICIDSMGLCGVVDISGIGVQVTSGNKYTVYILDGVIYSTQTSVS